MTARNHPTATSSKKVIEHLDAAIDSVLAARVEMGLLADESPVPDEALDAALGAHRGYQEARAEIRTALDVLHGAARVHGLEKLVLDFEAATNHMVAVAVEVGWQLGVRINSSGGR